MSEQAKQIAGAEQFPKMVYPGWDGEGMAPTNGVFVKNEEEEKWVNDGNRIEDFGLPPKVKKEAKPSDTPPVNPANPANPGADNSSWKAPE